MPAYRWTVAVLAGFLAASSAAALEVGPPDPLFEDDEAIDVTIVAPMSTLLSERPFDDELPATFEFTNSAEEAVVFDIQLRTRGRFRRKEEVCPFPPLRLNFRKSQTEDTLFHKQDKVKLVTHCKATNRYNEVLLREYMAYRILSLLSDASFQVRLLNITYVDSENKKDPVNRYGFIIEHRDRLAKRMDMKVVETTRTTLDALDPEYTNLVSVFQYMIGNTDFSPIAGAKDDYCCHNHVLIGNEGEPYWSVPYDFDQAGLIDAPHAGPNPRFRLRDVKERLYRGRCANNEFLQDSLDLYVAKQDEISALIDADPYLGGSSKRSMLNYLNRFYKVLDSERRVERELTNRCLGKPG